MSDEVAKTAPFLPSVQALRAIAALMVVLYHVESGINGWFAPTFRLPSFAVGAAGVDLFFLISGFIMVVTSTQLSPRDFMVRRLVRIVPLYWLSLLVFVAAAQVVPPREGQDHSPLAILASFLFLPYARPDGSVQPLNPVGWTLNYEMLFYAVFAVGLWIARGRLVGFVAVVLGLAVAWGAAIQPDATALRFWSAPIVLEFIAGMIIARVYLSGFRIGAVAAAALALLALAAFVLPGVRHEPVGWWRVLLWGGPALLLLTAAVIGPALSVPRALTRLGDASYSLYLLHLPVLLVFKQLGPRLDLPWGSPLTPWLAALWIVAASVAVSLLSYRGFESPVTRLLRGRLGEGRRSIADRARAEAS